MASKLNKTTKLAVLKPARLHEVAWPAMMMLLLGMVLIWLFEIEFSYLGSLGFAAYIYGCILGASIFALFFLSTKLLPKFDAILEINRLMVAIFRNIGWFGIVLLSLLAGIGEELMFRVVIQGSLIKIVDPIFAILVSSVLFGLMHYLSKLYIALTFLIGLFFGWVYFLTGSFVLIAVAHAIYDLMAFTVIVKYPQLLDLDADNSLVDL
ncbi:MAG: CPBP family intramembrane glutamic endopeptidase [Pseudomonadota bacterium]